MKRSRVMAVRTMRKLLLLTLALACVAVSAPHKSEIMNVAVGTRFTIDLPANRTTGYDWSVGSTSGNIIKLLSSTYSQRPHRHGLVGAPGLHMFAFKALRTGTEVVHFVYKRPWERTVGQSIDYTVRVKR